MPANASFRLSRIVVVESLEPNEVKTGKLIAETIAASDNARALGLSVEYHTCAHAAQFRELMHSLVLDVRDTGRIPLLHVECHGDESDGLEFENSSVLSWTDLSELLVELNRTTRFNLVTVFSACYGAHILSKLGGIDPAPFFAMIAPTSTVRPDEILGGFRVFYKTIFETKDVGVAINSIGRLKLEDGSWFGQLAESWYVEVAVGYAHVHCTNAEMKVRALRVCQQLRSEGFPADLGAVRRGLVQTSRSELLGKFFERYFMIDSAPENTRRFHAVRSQIEKRIELLRKTGRFGV